LKEDRRGKLAGSSCILGRNRSTKLAANSACELSTIGGTEKKSLETLKTKLQGDQRTREKPRREKRLRGGSMLGETRIQMNQKTVKRDKDVCTQKRKPGGV